MPLGSAGRDRTSDLIDSIWFIAGCRGIYSQKVTRVSGGANRASCMRRRPAYCSGGSDTGTGRQEGKLNKLHFNVDILEKGLGLLNLEDV